MEQFTEKELELIEIRKEKLRKAKQLNAIVNPYKYEVTHRINYILSNFDELKEKNIKLKIAGRIVGFRAHGKAGFLDVLDSSGKIQIYIKQENLKEDDFKLFELLDYGDIIGACGELFITKTGEKSIRVSELALLSKSLKPWPVVKEIKSLDKKFHIFGDIEERYRKRYLDLVLNPEVRNIFILRAKIIKFIREYLDNLNYIEVETPVLQPIYGGALAKPFETFYNILNKKVYLRIADELYLKRLLIAGLERVYEIGKNFRNEGLDRFHNPEFTALEFYCAYCDYYDMMKQVEDLILFVTNNVLNSNKISFEGKTIELNPPFKRISFLDEISRKLNKDVSKLNDTTLAEILISLGVENVSRMKKGKMLDELFDKLVAPDLIEPTFVLDYPLEISPLARNHREKENLVERFELFMFGYEIANAFSELFDYEEQKKRFEEQKKMRIEGDLEAHEIDDDFLTALEYGMPPAGGVGIGIDRFVMILTGMDSIRDVILFPQLR